MAYVKARDNEHVESLIKRFKRKVDNEGILKEFRDRQYYKKPSVKRRAKKKEAERKEYIKQLKNKQKYD